MHTIVLNDFHPGEYTQWKPIAPTTLALGIRLQQDEEFTDDNDGMARWTITSYNFRDLIHVYNELLNNLSRVTWDWYGLGGDDNCYDYWPNTMRLARDFLEQLYTIASSLTTPGELEDLEACATADLNRIYWLARMRYANSGVPVYIKDADEYFEADILSSEGFGECPSWIIIPTTPNIS